MYFHGGVSFAPYREQFQKIFPTSEFKFYETYNASEGFFAIQDRNYARDLLLMLDYGIFLNLFPNKTAPTPGLPYRYIRWKRGKLCRGDYHQCRALALPARGHGSVYRPQPLSHSN